MKHSAGWGSALLAALLHLQLLQLGGAVSLRSKQPPAAAVVAQLRQVLHSRTEELANQKNIAHGLQLEVRELQSELQAEKKAVAIETQKEHTLSQKLNRVRAVLDDGAGAGASPSASSKVAKVEKGPPPALDSSAFSISINEVDAPMKSNPHVGQLTPLQSLGEVVEPLPNVLGDDLEPPEEVVVQKAPAASQQPPQQPRQLPPQKPLLEESLPAALARQTTPQEPPPFFEAAALQAHARQTTPQEPPPFFEAAALQAAKATRTVKQVKKKSAQRKKAVAVHQKAKSVPQRSQPTRKVASRPQNAKPSLHRSSPATAQSAAIKPAAAKPVKQQVVLRGSSPATAQSAAIKPAAAKPAAMAASRSSSNAIAAAVSTDSDAAAASAGSGADFDALESQLHEEDRRIQDLDRENELDAVTDGGLPPATGSAPPAANSANTQPKSELDADAPMDDFLNVEAPGAESAGEAEVAAPLPEKDLALAQVTESTGSGLESALSDNEFLAQIAPAPRHA